MNGKEVVIDIDRTKYDDADIHEGRYVAQPGLNEEIVRHISSTKNEPEWMLQKRLKGLELWNKTPMPTWGPDLSNLNVDDIILYSDPNAEETDKWEDLPDEIKQTFDKLGIPEAEKTALGGVGGQYDCLTGDSIVYTNPKGGVKIKEIKPGDYVFSLNEETNEIVRAKVKAFKNKGERPIFEVKVRGRTVKSTYNHPFLCLVDRRKPGRERARYSKEWRYLHELKPGDAIAVATDFPEFGKVKKFTEPKVREQVKGSNQFGAPYKLNISNPYVKVTFPEESNEDIMWLFGFFIGDGFISKSKDRERLRLAFAADKRSKELRAKVLQIILKEFNYKVKELPDRLRINSTKICQFFIDHGFKGNARTKSMPKWVFSLPKKQKIAFIAGYIDADGTVRKNSKDPVITSVNKVLLEQVKELCLYCGINSSRVTTVKENKWHGAIHRLHLSGRVKQIPCVHPIKRKRLLSRTTKSGQYNSLQGTTIRKYCSDSVGFSRIQEITYKGKEQVYDIEVENHHNFIAEGVIVHNSSIVYHNLMQELKDQGVIFENMDVAIHKYPDMVKKYFMSTCIPVHDHKFIMLHAAVWSGGTFIYIPPGVKVELPLQAYFRMNQIAGGQFEHTLIIVDKGAELHYIEGCSSPRYNKNSLHAGCVELHVMEGATMRYTSIENWSRNMFNLNTKRALAHKNSTVKWVNGNVGCLVGDAKVYTNPKGPVNIQEIKEGDKVFVWDEQSNTIQRSKVTAVMDSGTKEVYKIEAGGRDLTASGNHPFLSLTRRKKHPEHKKGFFHFEWKPLESLREGDVIGIAKKLPLEGKPYKLPSLQYGSPVKSKNQYAKFEMSMKNHYNLEIITPKETNEDFMWIMGILIGDGFIDISNSKINIALHETDDLRPTFINLFEKVFNYKITQEKERFMEIYSKALGRFFTDLGFGGDAGTKKIPHWIHTLPRDQILAFLAGYFDADGHSSDRALAFTSINKLLLRQVKDIAISCGFGVSRIFKHGETGKVMILGRECNAKGSWRILLNGKSIHDLPMRSLDKKKRARKIKSSRDFSKATNLNFKSKTNEEIGFATIQKIVAIGERPTYDIEVEGYHNFIANGMIVHNSQRTMLYPSTVLIGEGAHTESLGIAFAGAGQDQDTGSKVVHVAPNTTSIIRAKSISKDGGISSYRGLVQITPQAKNSTSTVQCDALLIDGKSSSNTYPYMKVDNNNINIAHEATVGKIGEEEVFYLMSRGLSEEEATQLIVAGFIAPIVKALPLEYAIEFNKLIEIEMEGM